jgi:hypothetical protein
MCIRHCTDTRLKGVHVGDGVEEAAGLAELGEVGARQEVEHGHPHFPRQTQLVCLFVVHLGLLLFLHGLFLLDDALLFFLLARVRPRRPG